MKTVKKENRNKVILTLVVCFSCFYLIISLIDWNINPSDWHFVARMFWVLFSLYAWVSLSEKSGWIEK